MEEERLSGADKKWVTSDMPCSKYCCKCKSGKWKPNITASNSVWFSDTLALSLGSMQACMSMACRLAVVPGVTNLVLEQSLWRAWWQHDMLVSTSLSHCAIISTASVHLWQHVIPRLVSASPTNGCDTSAELAFVHGRGSVTEELIFMSWVWFRLMGPAIYLQRSPAKFYKCPA